MGASVNHFHLFAEKSQKVLPEQINIEHAYQKGDYKHRVCVHPTKVGNGAVIGYCQKDH